MRLNLKLAPVVLLCFVGSAAFAQDDKVGIQDIDAGEKVVVALNARKGSGQGCLDGLDGSEWKVLDADTAGLVSVGNLRGGCVLNIAAFSQKRAMLLTSLSGWKNGGGEIRTVTMKPPIDVPIVIWITHKDLESVAENHVKRAVELYRQNMVGFNLIPTFTNVSDDEAKVKLIASAVTPHPSGKGSVCSNVGSLKGHAYKANTLNVYYVKREGLNRNCAIKETPLNCKKLGASPKVDGNVTYLGIEPTENLAVLAHELGHAFGLRPICAGGHVDVISGFTTENIMFGEGPSNRNKFSLGQVFRMNTQKDQWGGTMIIANKLRPGPGRECKFKSWEATTHRCPPMNLGL